MPFAAPLIGIAGEGAALPGLSPTPRIRPLLPILLMLPLLALRVSDDEEETEVRTGGGDLDLRDAKEPCLSPLPPTTEDEKEASRWVASR